MDEKWRAHLKARRADLSSTADMLESGRIGSHEMRDGKQIDTSAEWAAKFREYIAEIDGLLDSM